MYYNNAPLILLELTYPRLDKNLKTNYSETQASLVHKKNVNP